nr:hypothetical protein 6 [bacterium]
MNFNQSLPGGHQLHRKHSWPTDHRSLNRSAAIARQTADELTGRCAAHCQAARERELVEQIIYLLQQRYADNPPAWVHRVVDQLINDSERFQSLIEEAWG